MAHMAAEEALRSRDVVGLILDSIGLAHFPFCAAVNRVVADAVREKQLLWRWTEPN